MNQYAVYIKQFIRTTNKKLELCDELDVLNFIEYIYNQGRGYSACNTARSAVSTMFDMLFGKPLGKSKRVCRMLKGIFNERPSLPKHSFIWDSDILLNSLDVDSEHLDLLTLSKKVVVLLTLLSSQRVATIASLNITDLYWSESDLNITITEVIKQTKPGRHQVPLHFRKYSNKNLCIVSQLKLYLMVTEKCRGNITKLWITTTKPTKPASKQTLSNWIRNSIKSAGILNFMPHSLRSASVSKAFSKNVPVDKILQAGGWSSSSVFSKFYNLPVRTDILNVSEAILP